LALQSLALLGKTIMPLAHMGRAGMTKEDEKRPAVEDGGPPSAFFWPL
jgi:hypothetical protein